MGKATETLFSNYENFLIIGDLNAQASDISVKDFYDICSFKHQIKEPKCYKNLINPKCINLMLINRQRGFQNSSVIDTDSHKVTATVLRPYFQKAEPKIICKGTIKLFQIMNTYRLLTHIYRILTIFLLVPL